MRPVDVAVMLVRLANHIKKLPDDATICVVYGNNTPHGGFYVESSHGRESVTVLNPHKAAADEITKIGVAS